MRKHQGFIVGGYPAFSRNLAVKSARELKVTHLMFVDADQTFPPDGIKRLLDHDKDIIGASYNERKLPLISTVKLMDNNGEIVGGQIPLPASAFKAYAVGMGFCLIKMTVFDKLIYPYFDTELEPEFMTEDIYFCKKARKEGFDIWCDPTLEVGHIGSYQF